MVVPTSYQHLPLTSTRNIRLLNIHPGSDSSELRLDIQQVCLDDKTLPPYSALSYCWEGQASDCPTLCDDATLHVTKNCKDAMMKLRMPEETVTLWIDSICIDQTNNEEKSGQVALMAEIYKNANQVTVWLGEWSRKMQQAVGIIKEIGDLSSLALLGWEATHEDGLRLQQRNQARVRDLEATTPHPSDDVLGSLFHRPWFNRMWTVQEVALARGNNVIIYNGPDPSEQLPWNTMLAAIDSLMVCHYPWVNLSRTVKLHKLLLEMVIMERWPTMKEVYDLKPGDLVRHPMVWPIIVDSREKGATDVRDKVFALYGVFQELKIARTLPAPDYSKSTEDVYRELTIACIESDRNLTVLFDAPSDRRHLRPHLASWVPDWSDSGWRGKGSTDCRIALTRDRFCAAGPTDPEWCFSKDGHRLQLRGKFIDEVILCGTPFCCLVDAHTLANIRDYRDPSTNSNAKEEYLSGLRQLYDSLTSWVSVCAWYDRYPATGETAREAFCRTLTQDFSIAEDVTPEHYQQVSAAWFDIMASANPDVEVFRARYGSELDDATIERVIEMCPPDAVSFSAFTMKSGGEFHSAAKLWSNRRGFYVTADGRMGTAPARTEVLRDGSSRAVNLVEAGDLIAVISGMEMPMVLRPLGSEAAADAKVVVRHGECVYRLVTHAYVHGIMYGEAWEDEAKRVEEIILV
ncbi:hypothetical protein LTR37_020389 [Vermiconidia calcicola]|uniref:Uncharacterized protein n=1 Tax=Vermiconidia calcicola TaxID=1690605 RepID=A0ACC3MDC1_9PEZI|nr:hypothetical protein LTR37_020389 [Vermiconidia calcicola]